MLFGNFDLRMQDKDYNAPMPKPKRISREDFFGELNFVKSQIFFSKKLGFSERERGQP